MQLLTPDTGLLFWMLLSFLIVFAILVKFGFPVIVKAVEKRKEFIDSSLEAAKQANEQLATIKEQGEKLLAEAREEQNAIRKEALKEKEEIISEARAKAADAARQQIVEATRIIEDEKEKAIREVRTQITDLSISIAEKIMKEKISRDEEQQRIINKLIEEASFNKS